MGKALLMFIILAVIFVIEGIVPHYRGRTGRVRHAVPHLFTAVVNGILTRLILAVITIAAIEWGRRMPVSPVRVVTLPPWIETPFLFLFFDIWMYWWHRVNHRFAFLWRFHRAHHSDVQMDTTSALRFHPGELILSTFIRLPMLILLGISFEQVVLFETMLNISSLFHHSNLGIPERWDGLLRAIVTTPNMHRVHHSVIREETDSNYTSLLSVWDRLFGTFRLREDTRAITTGLPTFREKRWQGFRGFMITPFLDSPPALP